MDFQMAAIARALSRAFITINEVDVPQQLVLFPAAGLFVSLLMLTYGIDLSLGSPEPDYRGVGHHERSSDQTYIPIARRHITTPTQNIGCDGSFANAFSIWWFIRSPRSAHQTVGSTESPPLRRSSARRAPPSFPHASTRADRGPRRHTATISATMSAGPANTASTLPSGRLRTQPSRPRRPGLRPRHDSRRPAPGPDRDLADHVAHSPSARANSLARLHFRLAHRSAVQLGRCARPLRFFGEVPSRSAFSVS